MLYEVITGTIEPLVTMFAAIQQPAVAHHRVDYAQIGTQPGIVLVLAIDNRTYQFRFAVAEHARPGAGDIV